MLVTSIFSFSQTFFLEAYFLLKYGTKYGKGVQDITPFSATQVIYPLAVSRSLICTFTVHSWLENPPIYRVRLQQKKPHDFQCTIEQSMKIDFVYQHFLQ